MCNPNFEQKMIQVLDTFCRQNFVKSQYRIVVVSDNVEKMYVLFSKRKKEKFTSLSKNQNIMYYDFMLRPL